jgi:hypothetical protein
VQTARGNLIYTAFATAVFTVIQYVGGVTEPGVLLLTALMFFAFTYLMLRLISRVMGIVVSGFGNKRRERDEAERGAEVTEPTTTRPDHVRRRRDRRRRR